jgi:hypothetical protein
MPEHIFDPLPIAYRGLFADSHLVDAQQFGRSLIGASKIANSVCHELLFDKITHDPRGYHVRFCVGPSKENGLLQELFAVVVSGLPVFAPFAMKIGKVFIEEMIKAMVYKVLHRPSESDKALDIIAQQSQSLAVLAHSMQEGHMKDKAFLQRLVTRLVNENRRPLRELPEPVGKTVRTMLIGRSDPIIIDEPSAEVLKSSTPLELGDEVEMEVEIAGVFKTNGACKIRIVGDKKIVSGKIADPALDEPNNIYTKTLNEGGILHVKPTSKVHVA